MSVRVGEGAVVEGPLVFVHVMKTAGTTFVDQVRKLFGQEAIWPYVDAHGAGDRLASYLNPRVLMSTPGEKLAAARLVSGHHPAAVAEYVAEVVGHPVPTAVILRDPVDRVVSHLKQNRGVFRLTDLSLEEVYEDPRIGGETIANLQTKVLAVSRAEVLTRGVGARFLEDHEAEFGGRRPGEVPTGWSHDDMVRAIAQPDWTRLPIEGRLPDALARLDTIDVVGLTERYADFVAAVEAMLGWELPSTNDKMVSRDRSEVPDALKRRIEADNALDRELYEHVCALVG